MGFCEQKERRKRKAKSCRHTVYHGARAQMKLYGRGDENGIIRAIKNTLNLQSHETDRR